VTGCCYLSPPGLTFRASARPLIVAACRHRHRASRLPRATRGTSLDVLVTMRCGRPAPPRSPPFDPERLRSAAVTASSWPCSAGCSETATAAFWLASADVTIQICWPSSSPSPGRPGPRRWPSQARRGERRFTAGQGPGRKAGRCRSPPGGTAGPVGPRPGLGDLLTHGALMTIESVPTAKRNKTVIFPIGHQHRETRLPAL